MTELFRATVGSRLYGIHREDSDHDRRGVKVTPLGELLLDSQLGKNKSTVDEEGDLTLYELNHFVRLLMDGNPTMLETFYSVSLMDTDLAEQFLPLLDSENALRSLLGYMHGALNQYEKQKGTEKAPQTWKNMGAGLLYHWLYGLLFHDAEYETMEDFKKGALACRAGDQKALEATAMIFRSTEALSGYVKHTKKADREYAKELLTRLYTE